MKTRGINCLWAAAAVLMLAAPGWSADAPVDPNLPVYQRVEGLKGSISLVGSDTMSHLASIWAESFHKLYPDVTVNIQVKGSVNAVGSVVNGDASFGLLSRQITEQEAKDFHGKFGYLPTVLTPSIEPLAIFVHKDNPIQSLTLAQLDAIFSSTRHRGAGKTSATWGDLGLTGKWAGTPVHAQIRGADTGSQVFFQAAVLGNGQFRADAQSQADNLSLTKAIAADPGAIGFAGAMYATPEVKAVPIAWKEGDKAIDIHTAGYPLVRPLQFVVNKAPGKQLTDVEKEFIKYVFSQRGQQDVIIGGFLPIPAPPAMIALDAAGVSVLK